PRFRRAFRLLDVTPDEMPLGLGDTVVILDLVGHLQRTAGLTLRILGQGDLRRTVGNRAELPLRLTRGRADMHGAVTGDGEMPLVGPLRRLLGWYRLGGAATRNDVERAAAGTDDQRAADRHRQRRADWRGGFLAGCGQDDRRLAGVERRRHP